jgi:nucleotide-binding universal stress UspA family protein
MKKILVPTDRSPNAQHALNYALELYKGQEVEFILFQSYDIPTYAADMPVPVDNLGADELTRILNADAEQLRNERTEENFAFSTKVRD